MPGTVSFYEYEGNNTKIATAMKDSGIPHGMFNRHIISFAGDVRNTGTAASIIYARRACTHRLGQVP
jgi:hypothetical protein